MPRIAPYGSWESPISAQLLAESTHPVTAAAWVGDAVWWSEQRPAEAGRTAVCRLDADGGVEELLPAPWSARSRVHEYGGVAWTGLRGPHGDELLWVEGADQRLWRSTPGGEPAPLTPAACGLRFAEPAVVDWPGVGGAVLAVCEHEHGDGDQHGHDGSAAGHGKTGTARHGEPGAAGSGDGPAAASTGVRRAIVLVPLDGSAAADQAAIVELIADADFFAFPRLSPDRRRFAWVAWDHPRMPWDGTRLRLAEVGPAGALGPATTIAGGETESVLQPEWQGDAALIALSDREGWWNPVRYALGDNGAAAPVSSASLVGEAAEYGGPLWQLGARWHAPLPGGGLLAVRSRDGFDRLVRVGAQPGAVHEYPLGLDVLALQAMRGEEALVIGEAAGTMPGLRRVDLATGDVALLRGGLDALPDPAVLPRPTPFTAEGPDGPVHALVSAPRNAGWRAPEGELPPYVFLVHGGPTARAGAGLSLATAYLTSRGIGVVEVNYGGSTGYGRRYRERLDGRWGVVDVADTIAVAQQLAAAGLADPARLAIRGGSAGGLTVLTALAGSAVFAGGVSRYGVADLLGLAADTHDFEAHYLDRLIGPLPAAEAVYRERSPLTRLDRLRAPMLLLQGLDDRVVPPAQSEAVRDALAARGVPHAYLAFAGEGHGFRRAETIVRAAEAELAFYGQLFGVTPPGVPPLELTR